MILEISILYLLKVDCNYDFPPGSECPQGGVFVVRGYSLEEGIFSE